MTMTMAEAKSRRNAKARHYESHGLHDYGSVRAARVALQNCSICSSTVDPSVQADMAEWMWRNHASPEEAATAFGLRPHGSSGWQH